MTPHPDELVSAGAARVGQPVFECTPQRTLRGGHRGGGVERDLLGQRLGHALQLVGFDHVGADAELECALRRHPFVNAKWTEQGILKVRAINLGIAISLGDDGLVVPVIKNADELSITGIARAVRDLATRARGKKLTIQDFEGGTFTVNNGGTLGTYLSYPIVNPGQAAIMTTESIGKRVVALDDDTIGIRTMGNVVMSFDHRVMDGATAAAFLRDVKAWIQGVDPANVALS